MLFRRFGKKGINEYGVIDIKVYRLINSCSKLTREFFLLYKAICKSAGSNRPTRIPKPWIPPYAGWLKANLDGAFDRSSNTGGVGVIVHDSQGVILGGVCAKLENVGSPELG